MNKHFDDKDYEIMSHGIRVIHSHKIQFNKRIYLDNYCVAIMLLNTTKAQYNKLCKDKVNKENKENKVNKVNNDIITKIINLTSQNNIPFKFKDYKCGAHDNVLNNFIDSIIDNTNTQLE